MEAVGIFNAYLNTEGGNDLLDQGKDKDHLLQGSS